MRNPRVLTMPPLWSVRAAKFVLGALRTNDVLPVSNKSLPCHGLFTEDTDEALRVPVATFK